MDTTVRSEHLHCFAFSPDSADSPELPHALHKFLCRAIERGGYGISLVRFCEHTAARLTPHEPISDQLDGLYAADLLLALACTGRQKAALADLHRLIHNQVASVLRRSSYIGATAEDVRQQVMQTLVAGATTGSAKLDQYAGRASLNTWLRVACARLIGRTSQRANRELPTEDELLLERATSGSDPELSYLKREYRAAFKPAFQAAFNVLSIEDRLLLRQQVVDGLSIDELARLYKTHRSTSARRLARIRDSLMQNTRRRLRNELGITTQQFEELMRLIRSQLDVSLSRLLA